MRDSIRWDYIRAFLEEDIGIELIPVADRYFKRHSENEEKAFPERFMAGGYGKGAAGYAAVVPKNGHLVLAKVKHKVATADGMITKTTDFINKAKTRCPEIGTAELPALPAPLVEASHSGHTNG